MESFHWDKNFMTGLETVDRQHHHLVDILNKFEDHLSKDKLETVEIEAIFAELFRYSKFHFEEEIELMSTNHIDQRHIDTHIKAHDDFAQEIEFMKLRTSLDNQSEVQHLLDFLVNWLVYHILGTDQNMARQIRAIQSGIAPNEAYDAEDRESDNATEPLLISLRTLFQLVSAQNKKLFQLNQSLEIKVDKRTKELSIANRRLEEMALTDVLTGLPNRRHAIRKLAFLWDESLDADTSLVCMMIDADNFKQVNDTYGHDAGDLVLQELADTLKVAIRSDDIACRIGGDEFLIICPNTNKEGGLIVAEHIRDSVSNLRVTTGDGYWHGSISIGMAFRSPNMNRYEDMIKTADTCVFDAKRAGKNCVRSI